jgi:hypothetical protein
LDAARRARKTPEWKPLQGIISEGRESMTEALELDVNGARRRVEVDRERTPLSVLRDDLELIGAKYG